MRITENVDYMWKKVPLLLIFLNKFLLAAIALAVLRTHWCIHALPLSPPSIGSFVRIWFVEQDYMKHD